MEFNESCRKPNKEIVVNEKTTIKHNVNIGFPTQVSQDSLNSIYENCKNRMEKYGYGLACKGCKYKGVNGADCMFNWQPRLWDVNKITE